MATELSELPDAAGHFEIFGGKFVPEALSAALWQLEQEFRAAMADLAFGAELSALLADYTGRPSPITEARRFAAHARSSTGSGSPSPGSGSVPLIVLKREDLNHTGSHKINNVLGQALLARRMGKSRLIAETGAGQHGVATATAAALFGMDCTVYMGKVDTERQVLDRYGRLPDVVAACVGGGSNALGIFADFLPDSGVELHGFEAGGDGVETGRHAATISAGDVGVLHGMRTYVLQDADGQTKQSHSISAGLDYPGVGPEHAYLSYTGRAHYEPITDAEAMDAFALLSRTEGIVPEIESAHALAGALKLAGRLATPLDGQPLLILVNLSGRGDKDVDTAIKWFDLDTRGRGSESGRPTADTSTDGAGLAMGGPSTGGGEQV